jgi:hypothetical protein
MPVDARLFERAQGGDLDCADALEAIDKLQTALHENDVLVDGIRVVLLWFARRKVSGDETATRIAELVAFDLGAVLS